ncbi:RNA methyltransferase [Aggregicoccus sp. 17bor-14]|uniref:THUMP domain-containing class I SAM-dependent RNA methyltransferase n=1 Tax=Myxococcaceae TaxID=31 RepID=UPI00129C9DF6|nr:MULTISPECIES: RNA methyltransferase [Myxococcaceae]MBF5042124.1 RNA methyltransferase [Simulacricoccus sp. 17bor-14]MRI87901.1 RNA methyltransferase [Aggregicoccus sp. 17bor-14]
MPLPVNDVHQREQLFVSSLPGLEAALADEARAVLRPAAVRAVTGGVELEGEPGLHEEANLRLRLASRVLLRLAELPTPPPAQLERTLASVSLARVWDGRTPLHLSLALSRAFAPAAVLSAAARAWRAPGLSRAGGLDGGETEEVAAGCTLLLREAAGRLTLSVDTSGEPLHRRGYRQEVSRAPLRETLAAGVLRLAGYDGSEPLVDPMCGSGTFLIEAGGMSQGIAPGLSRPFAFESFPQHVPATWEQRRARAKGEALERPRGSLHGFDLNAGALGTARRNARRAGLTLALERRDVRVLTPPVPGPGLLVANPPYGKRVGEAEDLPGLYRALGATVRGAFAGWRAALLVPDDPALLQALALPDSSRVPLRNGGLRCVLLQTGR